MILRRLRLANYRGIEALEVTFRPKGLTVVEGPNEAGKTSLSEAVLFLFDYPDSSKARNIEAIKPVHRDAGPEIELEAESGPYVFTYFKRFYKKPETTLTISRPKTENLTGREAHERAAELLSETMDVVLWRALCIEQGDEIKQVNLSDQTALSKALDIAASGTSANPQEESLFEKVQEEFKKYFTPGGKEKKELQEAKNGEQSVQADVASLEEKLNDIEKDIERATELEGELERLRTREQELEEDVSRYSQSIDEIEVTENVLKQVQLKLKSNQTAEQYAMAERQRRQELVKEASEIRQQYEELLSSESLSAQSVQKQEGKKQKLEVVWTKAEKNHKVAEQLFDLYMSDVEYFNDKLGLEQLLERKGRIDTARREGARAKELLATNIVDRDVLDQIEASERALIVDQAKLDTGAPNISLRGLRDHVVFQINEKTTSIKQDEVLEVPVSDRIRLTLPDLLDITVTPGTSAAGLLENVQKSKNRLEAVCKEAGVSDLDESKIAHEKRQEALRVVRETKQIEEENLRDLTYEELEQKLVRMEQSVPAYLEKRAKEPKLGPDLTSTKEERQKARDALDRATEEAQVKEESLDSAAGELQGFVKAHEAEAVELKLREDNLRRTEKALSQARGDRSDEDLETKFKECAEACHSSEKEVESAEAALKGKEPERARILLETARGSLQTSRTKREAAQKENTQVRTRLKFVGEDGLYEKLQVAGSQLQSIRSENIALFSRVSAVKLLYEVMGQRRDEARFTYVAPLKDRIDRLGQLVFNKSFEVEVNQDLVIINRYLDGVTVPFNSLSGGTKEQLSLISRLACAIIVSNSGGGSMVLDDALGYTDPERLKLMGAVLAKAAEECQVIILTCVPDRYSNVGEATVVRLG